MTIFEVLEYGAICASNEELGILITVNGSYLNFWVGSENNYTNTGCRYLDQPEGLYSITGAKMMDLAGKFLREALEEDNDGSI